MSRPVLRTTRIELRPMTPEHLPLLVELDSDPIVLRYILGRARTAEEARQFWAHACSETAPDAVGLGWWVGFTKAGDFLGWWDLSPARPLPAAPRNAEAGWRLRREHWRRGFASEAAAALLAYGFDVVGLDSIWAETMRVNVGSRGVMARLGMTHVRTRYRTWANPVPGWEQGEVGYEIGRETWLRARDSGQPDSSARSSTPTP